MSIEVKLGPDEAAQFAKRFVEWSGEAKGQFARMAAALDGIREAYERTSCAHTSNLKLATEAAEQARCARAAHERAAGELVALETRLADLRAEVARYEAEHNAIAAKVAGKQTALGELERITRFLKS